MYNVKQFGGVEGRKKMKIYQFIAFSLWYALTNCGIWMKSCKGIRFKFQSDHEKSPELLYPPQLADVIFFFFLATLNSIKTKTLIPVRHCFDNYWWVIFNSVISSNSCGLVYTENIIAINFQSCDSISWTSSCNAITSILLGGWSRYSIPIISAVERIHFEIWMNRGEKIERLLLFDITKRK